MATYTLVNGESRMRSIFVFDKNIVGFSQTYVKTGNMLGKDTNIVRFLDAKLSNLFLQYLIYIRPLQRFVEYLFSIIIIVLITLIASFKLKLCM